MTAQKYLKQAYDVQKILKVYEREIADTRQKAAQIRRADIKPVAITDGGGAKDVTGDAIAAVLDYEREIIALEARYAELKSAISRDIERVDDIRLKALLRMRYLVFMDWGDIAEALNYSAGGIFRLHKAALKNFSSVWKNGE